MIYSVSVCFRMQPLAFSNKSKYFHFDGLLRAWGRINTMRNLWEDFFSPGKLYSSRFRASKRLAIQLRQNRLLFLIDKLIESYSCDAVACPTDSAKAFHCYYYDPKSFNSIYRLCAAARSGRAKLWTRGKAKAWRKDDIVCNYNVASKYCASDTTYVVRQPFQWFDSPLAG